MAILKQNRKKKEFDIDKVLTSVTADTAKVGMKGYFANTIKSLKDAIKKGIVFELKGIDGDEE